MTERQERGELVKWLNEDETSKEQIKTENLSDVLFVFGPALHTETLWPMIVNYNVH